jgi:uncharacterized protein YbjT (DUF2867 family)
MRTLVSGASGFAGSLLIPRLRSEGGEVRALSRDPSRVSRALANGSGAQSGADVEVYRGDAVTGEGLARAMSGVDVAYYLIHSMERVPTGAPPFAERDRLAARAFAAAAARAGVQRIVYLGGLLPRPGTGSRRADERTRSISPHLASRAAVERILMDAVPGSVALRASIVIGARSRSFRLLVHLVERMRVLALPSWRRFRTQPVDARDLTEMLAAAATSEVVSGRTLDVGGPDVLSYGEMVQRIAELMLVHRPALGLGVSLTPLTAPLAAAIAGEDPALVLPLMGSLTGDLLPTGDDPGELLNVPLHSFDSAVEHALREWEEHEPLAAR